MDTPTFIPISSSTIIYSDAIKTITKFKEEGLGGRESIGFYIVTNTGKNYSVHSYDPAYPVLNTLFNKAKL
jgi:hypothetical protein